MVLVIHGLLPFPESGSAGRERLAQLQHLLVVGVPTLGPELVGVHVAPNPDLVAALGVVANGAYSRARHQACPRSPPSGFNQ
ncbi:hypothetical protein [Candidatus Poriferisodalis sp.]|uniref:hypothetical protein n=1 Tax=Candidatus Poriferisodalis sp. TaxID=3101277 RepID=UPI003B029480